MASPTAKRWLRVAGEVSLVLIFLTASLLQRHLGTPVYRGFFQSDESLMHPYRDSTAAVTEAIWLRLSLSRIKAVIQSVGERKEAVVRIWLWRMYSIYLVFFFGYWVNNLMTNILKYRLGRLRPHFMEVCQPDYKLLGSAPSSSCFGPYIEQDICTGDRDYIFEARLSFPSGHTSIAMYCAVFFVLYLEERMPWQGLTMLRPSLQVAALCLAFYVGCTRVSDYKHHWSDVLGGGILGTVIAICMPFSWVLHTHHPFSGVLRRSSSREPVERSSSSKPVGRSPREPVGRSPSRKPVRRSSSVISHKKKAFPRHHKTTNGLEISLLELLNPGQCFENPAAVESCYTQTTESLDPSESTAL
ncbi:hypothetical protein BaRGS_00030153 [Batillaria attramentaria]|uniref:Phosphatidic acid phosphatase type 2/haloperoxidase domain-containing protein n=1 Tax=Batillaria attramentaria TaxID=370345 RepID=A0ABD0JUY5_9CAEN